MIIWQWRHGVRVSSDNDFANAEFSPQPREVVGANRILGTLLR